jgi:hypothetical protein
VVTRTDATRRLFLLPCQAGAGECLPSRGGQALTNFIRGCLGLVASLFLAVGGVFGAKSGAPGGGTLAFVAAGILLVCSLVLFATPTQATNLPPADGGQGNSDSAPGQS